MMSPTEYHEHQTNIWKSKSPNDWWFRYPFIASWQGADWHRAVKVEIPEAVAAIAAGGYLVKCRKCAELLIVKGPDVVDACPDCDHRGSEQ